MPFLFRRRSNPCECPCTIRLTVFCTGASFGGAAQPHFNPAFFNQNQQGGGGADGFNQNPQKRMRTE